MRMVVGGDRVALARIVRLLQHQLCQSDGGPMRPVVRPLAVLLALALACAVASCRADEETTGSVNKCATALFPSYNAKRLDQCVAVCLACDHGTTTTCTTSCTLKGAR